VRTRWYLNRDGRTEGPFEEAIVVAWVRDGSVGNASVCPEGGQSWAPLASTPPFSTLLGARVAAPLPPSPPIATLFRGSGEPAVLAPPPSQAAPSSGPEGLAPAPWVVVPATPGLGQTRSRERGLSPSARAELAPLASAAARPQGIEDDEGADDAAWRDAPGVVERIGRRTPSQIPPAGDAETAKVPAPLGTRTPPAALPALSFRGPLPASAPQWMHHAQRMLAGLDEALRAGEAPAAVEAAIERAWAGWELDGSSERQIARLALLLEQTHTAIRNMPPERLERAYRECAEVVRQGMPKHARRRHGIDDVVQVTRELGREADAWIAVVNATSRLLGWSELGVAHAAQAIRVAIQSTRKRQ
jgi:hypothetical protein